MAGQMFTIEASEKPTLAEAAAALRVTVEALDASFGVITVDPRRGLHTVLVHGEVPEGLARGLQGPFSNPRIEPANAQRAEPADAGSESPDAEDSST